MTKSVLSMLAGIVALTGVALAADTTPSGPSQITAEDGVYTAEQAERGQRAYERECGTCHGVDLRGGETSISLMGRDFMQYWDQESLGILYGVIQETMPEDDPGRLSPQQTVDLIAMILSANRLPTGAEELQPDPDPLFDVPLTAAGERQ